MKNFITILLFSLCVFTSNAQVKEYYIIEECNNSYNKDMQSYNGWTEWKALNKETDNLFYTDMLKFSQSVFQVIRIRDYYSSHTSYVSNSSAVFTSTFIADEPTAEYPFRKKISIKCNSSSSYTGATTGKPEDNKSSEILGTGYVYSKAPYNEIMSGKFTGVVYFYAEMNDGTKFYWGYKINPHSAKELEELETKKQEAADEAAEAEADRKAEKAARQKRNIENGAKILNSLIKKN